MTRGWTGFRTAAVALGLLAWSAPQAVADNILTYSSSGAVGTDGVSGSGNVVSFVPVQNASVDTASNISLGYFQVAPLATGQTTTYDNTSFSLTLVPSQFNSTSVNDTPITVTGHLNGTVSGPYQSSVHVTFNPIKNPTFALPNGTGRLNVLPNSQELLVPSSVNNGQTTIQALVATATVGQQVGAPEPSTIALFLSTVGGLGLRRLVQKRRQRNAA